MSSSSRSRPAATRTLVVWCPDWPAVALDIVPEEAGVVVRANRVVATTPAARAQGVALGQRRREAQGRCPHLVVLERDLGREGRRFEAVVRAVEAFSPRIELTQPGTCAFLTRGPSRYFGGDHALASGVVHAVDAVLSELGWPSQVQVGIADVPFAARLAARSSVTRLRAAVQVVGPGQTRAFLEPLSVTVLEQPELTDVVERLGLRTLGALADLTAADVLGRFGEPGRVAHRLARGLDERPPDARPPAPDLEVVVDLDPPAVRVDTAAFVAKVAADDFHERLAGLGLSCTRVLVGAETEHGEGIERLWRHEGALSAGAIAERVRWQLDGWLNGPAHLRPSAGIARLVLAPDEVVPSRGRQLGFWGAETASTDRAVRAIARVQGLLGTDAVLVPEWRGGRGPRERVVLISAAGVDLEDRQAAVQPGAHERPWPGHLPAPSPATVHHRPLPAELTGTTGHPVAVDGYGAIDAEPVHLAIDAGPVEQIEAWAGPWPADERWWDLATRRRRARLQVVAEGRAHLLMIEGGRWWVEATYD